jgi:hypothetical protein
MGTASSDVGWCSCGGRPSAHQAGASVALGADGPDIGDQLRAGGGIMGVKRSAGQVTEQPAGPVDLGSRNVGGPRGGTPPTAAMASAPARHIRSDGPTSPSHMSRDTQDR